VREVEWEEWEEDDEREETERAEGLRGGSVGEGWNVRDAKRAAGLEDEAGSVGDAGGFVGGMGRGRWI